MLKHSFNVKYERTQAEDLKKRAIALKDMGFTHHAELLFEAARQSEAKAMLLHRIEQLQIQAKLNRRGLSK